MSSMSPERLQKVVARGERFEVLFASDLPEKEELSEILFGLSLQHGQGIFIVGVGRAGEVRGARTPGEVIARLKEASTRTKRTFDVNAVKVSEKWLPYLAFTEGVTPKTLFPGLTQLQEDILSALVRELHRNRYRSEVLATEDFENGWSFLLSGREGVEDRALIGEFDEIDLHALQEEGYITLLSKGYGYNLSLKRKAVDCYEALRGAVKDAPAENSYEWDLFISHASEDKDDFVRPLVAALRGRGLMVWYDEFSLKLGDNLRRSIDHGLAKSRFGVVVVSPSFLEKDWPQRELDGLVALEVQGRRVILPVWHRIGAEGVRGYSPTLADRIAVTSEVGVEIVARRIADAVGFKPNQRAEPDG
jgi:hypothetical protein